MVQRQCYSHLLFMPEIDVICIMSNEAENPNFLSSNTLKQNSSHNPVRREIK